MASMLSFLLVAVIVCIILVGNDAFLARSTRTNNFAIRMSTVDGVEMETGDFEQASFKKVANVKDNIAKYTLEAIIEKSSMNSYLLEYKEEMKRRKVLFPGFRAGKLPPYVMADVRKYLVCYGLETLMGQLCNGNGLKVTFICVDSYFLLYDIDHRYLGNSFVYCISVFIFNHEKFLYVVSFIYHHKYDL
jgi:hypothetical protein